MATLCQTPVRIYNTGKRKYRKHKHNANRSKNCDDKDETIRILKTENEKFRCAHKKIKMLTKWNYRSTRSAMDDVTGVMEILEECYLETSEEHNRDADATQ